MSLSRLVHLCLATILWISIAGRISAQSSSSKHTKESSTTGATAVDNGAVSNGIYRNKALGLACKIPEGWVLRTEEMNSQDQAKDEEKPSTQGTQRSTGEQRVLLATFSRPPEARGQDVNSSILIAAESVDAYPGLKDAAQYFGPLTEVAKAQGFAVDEEPYEFALGSRKLVRGDFHKDVGTRVMRQSTLAFLSHGYAVSITILGGTEDEVEELIDGISFTAK
ncbi:MAG: hypothetical protein ACM3ND_08150 [Acidobacteriota bacterium]|jgi:hypothetical protein